VLALFLLQDEKMAMNGNTKQVYMVWIEAEDWAPESWDRRDANTDVIVSREDGRRWGATFVSYQNVKTLQEKNQRTGESLSGAYLWTRFMILVDEISRQRIEAVSLTCSILVSLKTRLKSYHKEEYERSGIVCLVCVA
jgi:hypothetical protein